MKVLLVDDDSFLLDMYTSKFTEAGNEVVAVKDADHALEILQEGTTFDVLLADMVMPGMTGLELVATAKKSHLGGPACKYIMLSNQGESSDIEAAKQAGAMGFIIKAESMPTEVVEKTIALLAT